MCCQLVSWRKALNQFVGEVCWAGVSVDHRGPLDSVVDDVWLVSLTKDVRKTRQLLEEQRRADKGGRVE